MSPASSPPNFPVRNETSSPSLTRSTSPYRQILEVEQEFKDISQAEQDRLPLPDGWIRSLRVVDEGTETIYKNRKSGLELIDHPLLIQALHETK